MSNNIEVITQEEFEPKTHHNPRLTMTLPYLAVTSIPKLAEKKLLQKGIFGKEAIGAHKIKNK
jgi:hypothetical protein